MLPTSSVIQNELIKLADEVKSSILDAARSARLFSVLTDECIDVVTIQQMAICIRLVNGCAEDFKVREEFIGFVELEKLDAETISSVINSYLNEYNLDLTNLRGQGYDGATVMSGHVNGVCTQMQHIPPRALYHHCRGHLLNLVLSSSYKKIPDIRNLFNSVGKITWFLGASGKRKRILQ